jgi:hypothetical protein
MQSVFGRGLCLLALAIRAAPSGTFSQTDLAPPSATEDTYETSGLVLHVRTSGHGVAFDGPDDAEGGDRPACRLRGDRPVHSVPGRRRGRAGRRTRRWGLGDDEKYGVLYIKLGSRFHFRPGQQLEAYADVALAGVGLGYDETGRYAGNDVTYGGAGVSLGAGPLYVLSPTNLFQFTTVAPVEDDRFEGRAVLGGPSRIERSASAVLTSLRPSGATAFEIETACNTKCRLCISGRHTRNETAGTGPMRRHLPCEHPSLRPTPRFQRGRVEKPPSGESPRMGPASRRGSAALLGGSAPALAATGEGREGRARSKRRFGHRRWAPFEDRSGQVHTDPRELV